MVSRKLGAARVPPTRNVESSCRDAEIFSGRALEKIAATLALVLVTTSASGSVPRNPKAPDHGAHRRKIQHRRLDRSAPVQRARRLFQSVDRHAPGGSPEDRGVCLHRKIRIRPGKRCRGVELSGNRNGVTQHRQPHGKVELTSGALNRLVLRHGAMLPFTTTSPVGAAEAQGRRNRFAANYSMRNDLPRAMRRTARRKLRVAAGG